jgi:hypothetical protein
MWSRDTHPGRRWMMVTLFALLSPIPSVPVSKVAWSAHRVPPVQHSLLCNLLTRLARSQDSTVASHPKLFLAAMESRNGSMRTKSPPPFSSLSSSSNANALILQSVIVRHTHVLVLTCSCSCGRSRLSYGPSTSAALRGARSLAPGFATVLRMMKQIELSP